MNNNAVAMPASLAVNRRLDHWIEFDAASSMVVLKVGKIEIGQGIGTALVQIAADRLGVRPPQIRLLAGITGVTPDEMWTSASISVEVGGAAVSWACADVRSRFAAEASRRLGAAPDEIDVVDGVFQLDRRATGHTYWTLAADVDLDVDAAEQPAAALWSRGQHVGQAAPRLDLVDKLNGRGFIHDLQVPGMLHARVVRPPAPGATVTAIDVAAIAALEGVTHVRVDGSFVAVCSVHEYDAVRAQQQAQRAITWSQPAAPPLPDAGDVAALLRKLPVDEQRATFRSAAAVQHHAVASVRAAYVRPYLAHASIGTCCALAVPDAPGITVYTHSQGIYPLRDALARALGLAADEVRVVHRDGAGCYGHNGADDVALEAALLARACGRPVRVAWSREEEMTLAPFGPAMLVDVEASITADGRVCRWQQRTISTTHLSRPGWGDGVNLLVASQLERPLAHAPIADVPLLPFGGGGERNAVPLYAFGDCAVDYAFSARGPLRTSALRSLGAHANVFAIESMMDELAAAAGLDPLQVRLANLADERSRAVLQAAVALAGWTPSRPGTGEWGWGMALARYKNRSAWFAAVVEVELSHTVRVSRVSAAVDCGLAVNPDGVKNQIEGGIVQAISWALEERVTWDASGITSTNWESYPILGFDQIPDVRLTLLERGSEPPLGVGECTMGPIAAAIANAVRHAIDVRVRQMPITVDAITAEMQRVPG